MTIAAFASMVQKRGLRILQFLVLFLQTNTVIKSAKINLTGLHSTISIKDQHNTSAFSQVIVNGVFDSLPKIDSRVLESSVTFFSD